MPASPMMTGARATDPKRRRSTAAEDAPPPVADDGDAREPTLDEQARKRVAVGLSPRRPTAKSAPQRPPSLNTFPLPAWLLAVSMLLIVAVTGLLVWGNVAESPPSWWPVAADSGGATVTDSPAPGMTYRLRIGDDFGSPQSALRQGSLAGEWYTELRTDESVYVMTVWPNRMAWSLLGVSDLPAYRLQTGVAIDASAPDGYAGLMVRHQAEQGFYLFAIDGRGRYSVQVQTRGSTVVLQPWTSVPFLQAAPSTNMLTVEDYGDRILFYANQSLLYTVTSPGLPVGLVGLAAGAQGDEVAEIRFDWLHLYEAEAVAP